MQQYREQVAVENDDMSTSTAISTTTTTTISPLETDYNPSIDLGQYCGACRYYSRRLHIKKYCKRDYSKKQGNRFVPRNF